MASLDERFEPIAWRMRQEGLPPPVIESFQHYYSQLVSGATGMYPESSLEPVVHLPDVSQLSRRHAQIGDSAKAHTVIIKLNGGLGTSMGLQKTKSLLVVKENLTFLDIIARQSIASGTPLLLMNSFATQEDSLARLSQYSDLIRDLPVDFLQHKVPKIRQDNLAPVEYPSDPSLEWCPPGHGDLYTALTTTGLLEQLREHQIQYAFVSNCDNLGADLDERILGYFVENRLPFLMEVADRTPADKKGGHLAIMRGNDQRFVLRESAQCPYEDLQEFQNIEKHRFFNTNNLWIDLNALQDTLEREGGFLHLPMIRNSKTVDPRDPDSPAVFQLETAMGAAIGVFEDAGAIRVPRTRFSPVKTCDDLIIVRSDATVLDSSFRMRPHPARGDSPLVVHLDPKFYALISDFETRFAEGVPSMFQCSQLEIKGDFKFGARVVLKGEVRLENSTADQINIRAETLVTGTQSWN